MTAGRRARNHISACLFRIQRRQNTSEDSADQFNVTRAEVFEALGHPTRIKILQILDGEPNSFSELKRRTGIESSGLMAFHLGKLSGLVKLDQSGSYVLTDEGREALRVVGTSENQHKRSPSSTGWLRLPPQKAITAVLLIALIVLTSVLIYQQEQVGTLNNMLSSGTTTIGNQRYWSLAEPLSAVWAAKTLVFQGVNFTAISVSDGRYPVGIVYPLNVSFYTLPSPNSTGGLTVAFLPEIAVKFGSGNVEYWNRITTTVLNQSSSQGYSVNIRIEPSNQTLIGPFPVVQFSYAGAPTGIWLSQNENPRAGIGWDPTTGVLTFYISVG